MPWPAERAISFSATGDNVVVPAEVDEEIQVWQIFLVVSMDTLLIFKNGGEELTGPITMTAAGSIVLDPEKGGRDPSRPWFTATASNAFIINQSGSAQVSGRVYYRQGRPLSVA